MASHLNAEIASQCYMNSVDNAIEWLRATFLFVRVKRNPALYKLPPGACGPGEATSSAPE